MITELKERREAIDTLLEEVCTRLRWYKGPGVGMSCHKVIPAWPEGSLSKKELEMGTRREGTGPRP